jgi:hypothetical protein
MYCYTCNQKTVLNQTGSIFNESFNLDSLSSLDGLELHDLAYKMYIRVLRYKRELALTTDNATRQRKLKRLAKTESVITAIKSLPLYKALEHRTSVDSEAASYAAIKAKLAAATDPRLKAFYEKVLKNSK